MNAVKKLVTTLGLSVFTVIAASAASPEDAYLRDFSRGAGVPEPVKVVAPATVNAPAGASVMVSFVVDIAGVPQAVTVSESNHESLAVAAVAAVKQWRFTPVVRDGVTVETKVLLPVRVTGAPGLTGDRFASY